MFVRINGELHYLWRTADHEDDILEVFAAKRRDPKVALKFLKRPGAPRLNVNDSLRSYRVAMKKINIASRQECGRGLIYRAE